MRLPVPLLLLALASPILAGLPAESRALAEEVNVYSYREPQLIDPLLEAFQKSTGIEVNTIYAKDGLVERVVAEGANSPADVLLTAESGLLLQAEAAGIAAPVVSPVLEAAVPANLRDPGGRWFGLTLRARVVYASKERVSETAITYEDLADPKWKGRICSRSGQHTYNIALIASMIAHHGLEQAETWLKGVRDNLARRPSGTDRDQVKAVFAGQCDLAIGNTYYMGQMLTNQQQPEQQDWARSVKLLFPNAGDRGTHVNISGAAVMQHAPHREAAVKLIEFLASEEAQKLYAGLNHEYPVRAGVEPSELVRGWGKLVPDPIPLQDLAKLRKQASELVDKVQFDEGPAT